MTTSNTASIYINKIDDNYPIPGQSNDIQGLRDNFKNIKLGLMYNDDELKYIKLNSVLLTNPINDFNNNIIQQAVIQDFSVVVNDNTSFLTSQDLVIDYTNGNFQKFKFSSGSFNITISNWPNNSFGNLLIALYTVDDITVTDINFANSNVINLSNVNLPFRLKNNAPNIFELFSDGTSNTTYVKYYTEEINLSKPLNLANFSVVELASIPSSELKNGALVFITGNGYNKPAYYYNNNWYVIDGTLLT